MRLLSGLVERQRLLDAVAVEGVVEVEGPRDVVLGGLRRRRLGGDAVGQPELLLDATEPLRLGSDRVGERLERVGELREPVGDWGEVSKDDAALNEEALRDGSRLLSVYKLADQTKIWIITEAADDEAKREATTILLPSEY